VPLYGLAAIVAIGLLYLLARVTVSAVRAGRSVRRDKRGIE
jgi:hypothetical protein